MDEKQFNFKLEPGKLLKRENYNNNEVLISIIMAFYNNKDYIKQTVYSVLNQTFPCFELLIIDDGSTDKEALEQLEEIEKLDTRIKVFHKENEGASMARDYGAKKSSASAKYLAFLDDDDLIEKTYLECAYFTLETNKEASWAYTDLVGFDGIEYTWNKWFSASRLKKVNDLVNTCLIRKQDFLEVNGFELKEKNVYEDWYLWLKLLEKGKFPVRMNFYGMWYRRKKDSGELYRSKENNKRALEIINNIKPKVSDDINAIQYPRYNYNWDLADSLEEIPNLKREENSKINILMIIPWMVMGGADKFNIDLLKGLDKDRFDITVISTEPETNLYRQEFEKYATVYDLTTFLDPKYWLCFVEYIINKNNINLIFNTNSEMGYSLLPYLKAKNPNIPIIDYVHMEEWYNRNGGYSRDSSFCSSIIDKTLTCNKNSEDIFINHFGRKENEIQTVYIGVDENKFNPNDYDKDSLKEKYKIPKDKFIISYICRIADQKRPLLLLQIIKEISKKRDDLLFLIVGDGPLKWKVEELVKKLEIKKYVQLLESTKNTQEIYRISDITINCSIKEGLALTSYESLAMGVPVISSDVGGQKELISDEVGVIVPCLQKEEEIANTNYDKEEVKPYVDAIEKVLDNLDKYKEKCRQRILDGFTLKSMVENMTDIFNKIAENPNEEKVKNGEALYKNLNITKELFNKYLLDSKIKYTWLCDQYNKKHQYANYNYKFERFKEIMWEHKWYRGLIKLIKMTGIKRNKGEEE